MKASCLEMVRSINGRARDGSSAGCCQPVVSSWSFDRHGIGDPCRVYIREYRPLVPTRGGSRVVRRSCSVAQLHIVFSRQATSANKEFRGRSSKPLAYPSQRLITGETLSSQKNRTSRLKGTSASAG